MAYVAEFGVQKNVPERTIVGGGLIAVILLAGVLVSAISFNIHRARGLHPTIPRPANPSSLSTNASANTSPTPSIVLQSAEPGTNNNLPNSSAPNPLPTTVNTAPTAATSTVGGMGGGASGITSPATGVTVPPLDVSAGGKSLISTSSLSVTAN